MRSSRKLLLASLVLCVALILLAAGLPGAAALQGTPQPTYGPIPVDGTPESPTATALPVPPTAIPAEGSPATEAAAEAPTVGPTPTLPDWADAQVLGPQGGELRTGAGEQFHSLGTMPPGTPLRLVARDESMAWFQVVSADARVGWVEAGVVTLRRADLTTLPVGWIEPAPTADPLATPTTTDVSNVPAATAGLSPAAIERAAAIYRHGQLLGNNTNTLMLIGDSVNEEGHFLRSFAEGNFDLGTYTYFQPTIDAYNAASAFSATYLTEHTGFTYAMILDPMFADPEQCLPGESVLDCEYRLKKPSIAIIYLGLNDMRFFQPEQYQQNMDLVLQTLTGYGVVPILTTFTVANEYEYAGPAPDYLAVMRDSAARFQIPLIEFYDAAETLPHRGTGIDGAHLTFPDDYRVAFTGDQRLYGTTLRELLTMQALHDLRVNAFGL
jgi:hypothetical protein